MLSLLGWALALLLTTACSGHEQSGTWASHAAVLWGCLGDIALDLNFVCARFFVMGPSSLQHGWPSVWRRDDKEASISQMYRELTLLVSG